MSIERYTHGVVYGLLVGCWAILVGVSLIIVASASFALYPYLRRHFCPSLEEEQQMEYEYNQYYNNPYGGDHNGQQHLGTVSNNTMMGPPPGTPGAGPYPAETITVDPCSEHGNMGTYLEHGTQDPYEEEEPQPGTLHPYWGSETQDGGTYYESENQHHGTSYHY